MRHAEAVKVVQSVILHYDKSLIRQNSDILKVIGEYVPLRRVGASGRWAGLCPFHQEKTPSFFVNQTRQSYKCFGCEAGGDVISFVMAIEGLTFPLALAYLAERAGIQRTSRWGAEDRLRYSRASGGAEVLAERLADFRRGLIVAIDPTLKSLGEFLIAHGIDSAEGLGEFHQLRRSLSLAKARDIGEAWRTLRFENPSAVTRMIALGREDLEHAEMIAKVIVNLLSRVQEKEAAA
jgi:hypothetical protein